MGGDHVTRRDSDPPSSTATAPDAAPGIAGQCRAPPPPHARHQRRQPQGRPPCPGGMAWDELFPLWRYHAVFTDSPFELIQAEGQPRGHAVIEQGAGGADQVVRHGRDGKPGRVRGEDAGGKLGQRPAGNVGEDLASLPFARARSATIRRDLIAAVGRTARHGRGHITLHLPEAGHREQEWRNSTRQPAGRLPLRPDQPRTGQHLTRRTATRTPSLSQKPGQAAGQASGRSATPRSWLVNTK
jgi:hypothetical protein